MLSALKKLPLLRSFFTEVMAARQQLIGAAPDAGGVVVTPETALSASAVYACIRNLAEDIAGLPLKLYRKGEDGERVAIEDGVARLLAVRPNEEMTAFDFRSALMVGALLYGRGVAEIERDGIGRPVALWPIEPWRVECRRENGCLCWVVDNAVQLPMEDVLHLKGLSVDGVYGLMLTRLGRVSIGAALATERFAAQFFANGARPSGVITHPKVLSDTAAQRMQADWQATHGGVGNAHRVAVLEEGAKYEPHSINPEEAQFLQSRQFSVEDICRWFRMPPHLVQHLLRATFSNIEHQSIEYCKFTLRPWLVRLEQEFNAKLLLPESGTYVEHNLDALLRGDQPSRYAAYATGIQWGFLSRAEVARRENLPAPPDGEEFLVPANMLAATALPTEPADDPAPAPPAADPAEAVRAAWLRDVLTRLHRYRAERQTRNQAPSQSYFADALRPVLSTLGASEARVQELASRALQLEAGGVDAFIAEVTHG